MQINQLVNTLNRQPPQMSPGRSALAQQLQQNMAQLRQPRPHLPDVPVYYGHDTIESGRLVIHVISCVSQTKNHATSFPAHTLSHDIYTAHTS